MKYYLPELGYECMNTSVTNPNIPVVLTRPFLKDNQNLLRGMEANLSMERDVYDNLMGRSYSIICNITSILKPKSKSESTVLKSHKFQKRVLDRDWNIL